MATEINPYVARVAPSQPSAPRIQLDTSVGEAVSRVGNVIMDIGARQKAQQKQRDAQNAQLGLMKLNEEAQQDLIERDRNGAANGANLAKDFNEKFLLPKTQEFLSTLPDDLKDEYAKRVEVFSMQHLNGASNAEYKKGNEFSQTVVTRTGDMAKRGIAENPVRMKDFIDDFNASVDNQPNLTTAQREKFKADFAQAAPVMMAEALKVNDPETLVAMLGGKPKDEVIDYVMPSLTAGVYAAETSSGANNKTSKAGARGAMQVMLPTAREMAAKLGDNDFLKAPQSEQERLLETDYYSMRYGKAFLREQMTKYDGDIELALIAYNAGGKRVDEFIANGRKWDDKLGAWANETGPYVSKVISSMGTKALAGRPRVAKSDESSLTGQRLPIVYANGSGRQPVKTDGLDPGVVDKWEQVQGTFGRQVNVVSGYRDQRTNDASGGAKHSQHIEGAAIDLDVSGMGKSERLRLIKIASAAGFTGIGVYSNSIHLDIGSRRAWGPTHHGDSVPEWARDTIMDHLAGGYGGAAPAASTGPAGSGAEGSPRGVVTSPAPRPVKFTGDVAAEFAGMPGTSLISLRSEAMTASKQKTEEQKQAEANLKTQLVATAEEDANSLLTSGKGIVDPGQMKDFEAGLLRSGGLDEVNKWQHARFVNANIYEATKNLGKMSVAQINDLVQAVKPTGGETATQQIAIEAGVVDKVTKELEKRGKDPAAYVQNDPDVQAAIGKINKSDITSVERYFDSVKTAQAEIGLPFTPLSADEAKKASEFISKTFIDAELAGVGSDEAAKQILSTFEKSYGGFADDVYVQALSHSLDERVSRDTKQLLSQTFIDWIKANPSVQNPKNTVRDKINHFLEISDQEKATAPLSEPSPPSSWMNWLGMEAGSLTPFGAAKDALNLWETLGKPAAKGLGAAVDAIMPQPQPEPPEVPYDPTPAQPAGAGTAPKPPFTMPGIKDNDLNTLGSNANDPAVQDRFRNSYGDSTLKEALKLLKEKAALQ